MPSRTFVMKNLCLDKEFHQFQEIEI